MRSGCLYEVTVRNVVVVIAALISTVLASVVTDDPFLPDSEGSGKDLLIEWVAEHWIMDGGDQTVSVSEMSDHSFNNFDGNHPRIPAGLVINLWVALLPEGRVLMTGLVIVGVSLGVTILLAERIVGRRLHLALVPLLVFTPPAMHMIWHRGTQWVVTIGVLWTWLMTREEDRWWLGLPLAAAAGLRLWPLLLVVYLIVKRPRAGFGALGGFVALNMAGLLFPGVSIAGSVATLREPMSAVEWPKNMTIIGAFDRAGLPVWGWVLSVLVIGAALWWSKRLQFTAGYGWLILAALVAAPTSWPFYRVVLLPLALTPLGWLPLGVEYGFVVLNGWVTVPTVSHGWYALASSLALGISWGWSRHRPSARITVDDSPTAPDRQESSVPAPE